ncbi:MAG: PhoH family protein [Verrucomicrobiaceae bacterium]|nr:PhoH family protein [Verrucomicrobiaceae bacterium]
MSVETITYETPQFLQGLIANDQQLLRRLGEALSVKITSRDAWVRMEGESAGIAATREVLVQLEKIRRQGGEVSAAVFNLVLDSVREASGTDASGRLMSLKLLGSTRRQPVLAKTRGQIAYLEAMQSNEVVFGVGPAGTGKTYLAMAQGLHYLREKVVQRLVLTRPAVEAGEALGFLPGDLKEKIFPYLRPLYDALFEMLETEEAERLIERGFIEIAPLAYMRGRTLKNAFIILDEAQNTTTEQMLMFLTRLGEGSRCVVTGDPSQVDLRRGIRSGLSEAMHILPEVEGVKFMHFEGRDIVRQAVVQRIVDAYRAHREGDAPPPRNRP